MDKKQHLIWIDLEMTGLIPESDRIIEIATIITNTDLQVVAEGPVLAIHQSNEALAGMDDWNQRHHGSSGLIERVKVSPTSEIEAEKLTVQFLSQYCDKGFKKRLPESMHDIGPNDLACNVLNRRPDVSIFIFGLLSNLANIPQQV